MDSVSPKHTLAMPVSTRAAPTRGTGPNRAASLPESRLATRNPPRHTLMSAPASAWERPRSSTNVVMRGGIEKMTR